MSLTNPNDLVNEQRLSEFYQQIYPYLGGGSGRAQPKKTEIIKQTNVAIADGTAITLNLTKKYVNPYVFATNTLPKTGWGGLVTVNEDYGVTYNPTNNTLSFKTYTNYAQNYDIYWMVIELNDAGGGSGGGTTIATTLWENTTGDTTGTFTLLSSIDNFDALNIYTGIYSEYTSSPVAGYYIANPFFVAVKDIKEFFSNGKTLCLSGWGQRVNFVEFSGTTMSVVRSEQSQAVIKVVGIKFKGGSSDQNNYSTTEQIVGTWIDGSPVYQKVVTFTPSSGDYTLDLSSLHIGHLIEVSGIVRETNGNDVSASYYTSSGDYVAPYFTISGGVFHARYGGSWNGGEWNVILKYIKSTS